MHTGACGWAGSARSAGDLADGGIEEVRGELLNVEGGGRDDEAEVWALLDDLLHEAKEDIGVDGAFVGLVQDDD